METISTDSRPPSGCALSVFAAMFCAFALALFCRGADPEVRVVESFKAKECSGNSCRIVPHEWRTRSDDIDRVYLFRDGRQIGGWDLQLRHWRSYSPASGVWGEPEDCAPFPVPEKLHAEASPMNHGIDLDKMREHHERTAGEHWFSHSGEEVDRDCAFAAVRGAGGIPDDADCLRVTYVGDAGEAAKLRSMIDALPAWKDKVCVQDYRSPDEPILRDLGFTRGLQVQSPAGKPLWYAAQVPAAADLAGGLQLADARRKDPAWRPEMWAPLNAAPAPAPAPKPDPPKPDPAPPAKPDPDPAPVPAPSPPAGPMSPMAWCCIAAAFLLAVFLKKKT